MIGIGFENVSDVTAPDGTFEAMLTTHDLVSGDEIQLICQPATGDRIQGSATVP